MKIAISLRTIFLSLLCFIPFSYYFWEITTDYLSRPIVSRVDFINPKDDDPPSISVCLKLSDLLSAFGNNNGCIIDHNNHLCPHNLFTLKSNILLLSTPPFSQVIH